ncbi:hypothetical protein Micbo1qcDRAFT_177217 [Microdochium bolleyi]|uniref:Uncharacterized protein n=1 Tax=Microdochium bolleyi TaxID=196109 RepID=A0A136IWR3_9PEZI|nr:hypothetical protein Micbo1qcDRAFT_177217 [Microdochium bolleyi]
MGQLARPLLAALPCNFRLPRPASFDKLATAALPPFTASCPAQLRIPAPATNETFGSASRKPSPRNTPWWSAKINSVPGRGHDVIQRSLFIASAGVVNMSIPKRGPSADAG